MRNTAFVAAVLLVVILGIGLLYSVRSATAPPVAVASAPASPTSTPAPSVATPSPSPSGILFVNQTYKFSVILPPPYRKSARLSATSTTSSTPGIAFDGFTARTVEDEAPLPGACDVTCPLHDYTVFIEIQSGVSDTPRHWYTSHAGALGQQIDDLTVDGRPAIRVINGAEIYVPLQLIVKDGDRMFRIGYMVTREPVPAGASQEKLDQILASFRFLP